MLLNNVLAKLSKLHIIGCTHFNGVVLCQRMYGLKMQKVMTQNKNKKLSVETILTLSEDKL